jgi:AraC-like DNA-binding protein
MMQRQSQDERRLLDLRVIGLAEVPVFGRYEYCSARPGLTTHMHPHAVEICYLERGCQTYRTGGREYHLVGGDVFVTAPGEPHDTGGRVEERGILYWMNLKIPKAGGSILMLPAKESGSLVSQLSNLPHRHFPGRPALKQIFNEIFSLCERPKEPLIGIAVANHLVRLILETINCAQRYEGTHQSPVISKLVERIRSCPERNYSLAELAAEVELSPSRFKSKFKAQIGIAPHEFILRCKMEAAKQMLLDRRKSVTDTAMELGFSSSQYFATVFRRFTRQTPVEFCVRRLAVPLRRASHAKLLQNSGEENQNR